MSIMKISILIVIFLSFSFQQELTYVQNPLVNVNTPDPGVIYFDNNFYAVTTSGDDSNIFPIRKSENLRDWDLIGYIFPQGQQPTWALSDFWAPELHNIQDKFIVCYTGRNSAGFLSIGLASSDKIEGPYTDYINNPVITNTKWGNIDSNLFVDPISNKVYLTWKQDGNDPKNCLSPPCPTPILQNQINITNFQLIGETVQLIDWSFSWEQNLIEAPWIIYNSLNQYYYLFYSAAHTWDTSYCIGVARSKSVFNGFEKLNQPILKTQNNATYVAPGHCSVLNIPSDWNPNLNQKPLLISDVIMTADDNNDKTDSSKELLIFHHCYLESQGWGIRYIMLDKIFIDNDWPYIANNVTNLQKQNIP